MGKLDHPLANVLEDEAVGRVLAKDVVTRRGTYTIRWKIVGFCPRKPSNFSMRAHAAAFSGKTGNHWLVLERLDNHASTEPRGTLRCYLKSAVAQPSRGPRWYLEERKPDAMTMQQEVANHGK